MKAMKKVQKSNKGSNYKKISFYIENELYEELEEELEDKNITLEEMINDAITIYRVTQLWNKSYEIALQNIMLKHLF